METSAQHIDLSTTDLLIIRQTSCYTLAYDASRVRLYYSILGYWKNEASVADLLTDWDKALSLVVPGFTLLADMRTMITHPQKLLKLHEKVHQKVAKAGVSKVANVLPADKIASLQVAAITTGTKIPLRNFDSLDEAMQWLDDKETLP